jgi:hypothetical protein
MDPLWAHGWFCFPSSLSFLPLLSLFFFFLFFFFLFFFPPFLPFPFPSRPFSASVVVFSFLAMNWFHLCQKEKRKKKNEIGT